MRIVQRLKLRSLMATAAVTMILLALATVSGIVYLLISDQIQTDAVARQNASLRIAAEIVERDLPGTEIVWSASGDVERVIMADIPESFAGHDMIDTVGRLTGETATIFKWDPQTQDFWRKTTNIVKPGGERAVGTQLGQSGAVYPVLRSGETFRGEAVILGTPYYTIYEPIYSPAGEINGILYAGVRKSVIHALMGEISSKLLIASALILIVSAIAMTLITRWLLSPLPVLSAVTNRLAEDDLEVDVPFDDWENEVGQLAKSVSTLKLRAQERHELAAAQRAEEDQRRDRQHRVETVIARFREQAASLTAAVTETAASLATTSHTLNELAGQGAGKASETTTASDETSRNVETVASAAEELIASISEISRQVGRTTEVVDRATEGARDSNVKMQGLADAATRIGEVVTLIEDIAGQTNLLALNATIEAARAGEAGKGFAVVAAEVKALATQTSKATGEISAQVSAIQASTQDAVDTIGGIASTMTEIDEFTSSIATAMEQQRAATADIAENVQHAARGTGDVTRNMSTLSAIVDQTADVAEGVLGASDTMSSKSTALGREIDRFLEEVAAA
ncbi:methyl-accepting chemotaxis protein [Amorphus orientalis]|uniref:Methyl-accepting chemotaxis protein n=1 Tax=Amorphus orientalis TaxID=649198 RepID=A0AAE3VSF5_9HYPH|nr:methyl-accepting chemotaxis protein [Amorphus orientalis]MDQ0317554.1 methyl-accepting chemotaxis protein [Amorphus orientalis]